MHLRIVCRPGRFGPASAWLALTMLAVTALASPASASCEEDGPYVLGVEDVLRISVWQQPDLTLNVVIRPDGMISFPLMGDVQAAGRTAEQLAAVIREGLTQYVRSPIVTVMIEEIRGFKVYVLGKVASQGVLELRSCTQILQALAQAGGFTQFANRSNILLLRRKGDEEVRILIDYKKILSGERPEMNLYVKPGDTIIVD